MWHTPLTTNTTREEIHSCGFFQLKKIKGGKTQFLVFCVKCTLQQLGDCPHFHVRAVRWEASITRRVDCWESLPPSRCCEDTSLMLSFLKTILASEGFFPRQWHWRLIELLSSRSIQREVILNITLLFFPASDFLLLLMFYSCPGRFSETFLATERRLGSLL